MGLFSSFKNSKSIDDFPWIQLNSKNQLETIKASSYGKPIIIFKHSTRCGISSMVLKRFISKVSQELLDKFYFYYLDLLSYRDLSNEVADSFNVLHQSPQILVIKDGSCTFNASHYDISQVNYEKFI